MNQRILAVDFGARRTGLAATDDAGLIEVPLPAIEGLDDRALAQAIAQLCDSRNTELVVVGVPLGIDGRISQQAQRCLDFARHLVKVLPCPVVTTDEACTTQEAEGLLRSAGLKASQRRGKIDSTAALSILRRYRSTAR